MTSFCQKCKSSDYTSCMVEYENQLLCRKCQAYNDLIPGIWECGCGEWSKVDVRKMINGDGWQPKCNQCNEQITRRPVDSTKSNRPAFCGFNPIAAKEEDLVNHPSHYQSDKFEVIDIIEAFNLNFNLGNAVKYILRAGKKDDRQQDLEKAQWYLNRELSKYE